MKAIQTKYLSPTANKGPRIKATCWSKSVTIPFNHALRTEGVHFEAVKEFVKKHELDWDVSTMTYGSHDMGATYTFCFPFSTVTDEWIHTK